VKSFQKLLLLGLAVTWLTACGEQSDQPATEQPAATQSAASTPEKTTPAQNTPATGEKTTESEPLVMAPEIPPSGYVEVEPQADCDQPTVIEFFAYHCPHCYALEPRVEAWREKTKDKVKFIGVPSTLGHEQMGSLLLVHHAAKLLGIEDKVRHDLFERFHVQHQLFSSPDEAAEFLAAHGADKAKALAVLQDEKTMGDSINADYDLLRKYQVTSVPMILVNHHYMTSITWAGGHDEVFKLVDQLLTKENSCHAK